MPRGSDVYSSPWLKACDLDDDEATFTIVGSELTSFKDDNGKEKPQIVLLFDETEKKFGLNITNYRVLESIFGSDDSDDWHGKKVVLFISQTTMKDGRSVDCLRVKQKATEKLLKAPARPARPAAAPTRQTAPPVTQAEVDADDGGDIPF